MKTFKFVINIVNLKKFTKKYTYIAIDGKIKI